MSINLNIDIDANNSSLIEEDRTKLATYLSGTGTGKKFRSTDKSTASFGTCNLVPISRIYSADNPIENWTLTFSDACHEALLESILTSVDLMHDDSLAGCHWTASESHTNCTVTLACPMFLWPWFVGVAPVNITATVNWDLSITNAGSGNVNMLLTVTLSFSPDPGDPSHAVTYALNGQAATATGPFTLTATTDEAGRTYNPAGGTDEIVFPETIELTTSSTPTDVTRICDVYLTEVGNDWFLNFDYHRASNPNSENYYIEKDAFQVEVGPGTAYETLGDIEGVRFSFDHPGANNATPANGTEDATIAFTILSFNQGGLFQSGFVG